MADPLELTVRLSGDELAYLETLIGEGWRYPATTIAELAEFLLRHAADGVRRPGSWERGWIQQATGLPDALCE